MSEEEESIVNEENVEAITNDETSESTEETNVETSEEQESPEATTPSEELDLNEDVVTIGESKKTPPEESHEAAPEWVRKLRKSHRDSQSENRELRKRLDSLETPKAKAPTLKTKPKLEDFEYDTDKYEAQLAGWYEEKQNVDRAVSLQKIESQKHQQSWQQKLTTYGEEKSKLKVSDFDDSEAAVLNGLDQTQQGIIVQGADNSALLVYALGRNEKLLKDLSAIKDPIKFTFAVAKLEKTLKVTKRKAPEPERAIKSTGGSTEGTDSTLKRLRAEADRTGDQTKVIQYRRKIAAAKK